VGSPRTRPWFFGAGLMVGFIALLSPIDTGGDQYLGQVRDLLRPGTRVLSSGLGAEVSLKDFRKDIMIEVYNEAGQLALAYKVFRCWVSEYQSLPDLDANANAVAIQHIKLENEGIERDYEVPEPSEPSFVEP